MGNIAFDGGGDKTLLKLAAARVVASDRMPYLSTAMFAMVPVRVEGLGTFASDDRWRLYYDPKKVEEWSVDQIAGVLLHEVNHCIRGHATRFKSLNEPMRFSRLFNIAGDALINGDLRDDHISLPEAAVFIEHLEGATREMSAEHIYNLLRQKVEEHCTCSNSQAGEKSDEQNQDSNSGSGEQGENGEQGNQPSSGSQQGDKQEGQEGSKGSDPNCPVHGNGIPEGWDCGSASDGIRRDYEAEGDKVDAGVDDDRADLIRQQTAVEIQNHSRNRGNVPAGLARWAKELLEPVVDWRRELASLVRRTFASVAGLRDYTYARPSRRHAAMKQSGQEIILPAMRQPNPPKVAIVIDTSGSMSDDMLAWALSETQGVLRSLGASGRQVRVISCDADASTQRVTNVSQVKLQGGGGTDMRVGIEAAMNGKEKPDAIVVLTDGYTPWPDAPLKGTTLIVGLTDEDASRSVPSWARTVVVSRQE